MVYVTEIPAPSGETDVLKYTVLLNDGGLGGVITVAWPSTASTITIYRETTDIQSSAYDDYNQFPADTVESDFDKRVMVTQEISEQLDRTLKYPITASAVPTGGTGSAGAGKQYIVAEIDGVSYKLLHDGTV